MDVRPLLFGAGRAEQDYLFCSVEKRLDRGESLVAFEGPTGIGKSAMMGLLAARYLGSGGVGGGVGRLVVIAGDKSHQRGLEGMAQRVVEAGLAPWYQVLQGRDNYVCWERVRRAGLDAAEVSGWLRSDGTRIEGGSGGEVSWKQWRDICSSPDWCTSSVCGLDGSGEDSYSRALARCRGGGGIVIVNGHVGALDAQMGGKLLSPPPVGGNDVLLVDEAHKMIDVLSSVWGASVSIWRGVEVVRSLEASVGGGSRGLVDLGVRIDEVVELVGDGDLVGADGRVVSELRILRDWCAREKRALRAGGGVENAALDRIVADLEVLVAGCGSDDVVVYRRGRSLEARPLDVGGIMRGLVSGYAAAVVMSATLVDVAGALGIGKKDVLVGESPFDLRERRVGFVGSGSDEELHRLVGLYGGKCMVLATSHREADRVVGVLRERGWRVAQQTHAGLRRGGMSVEEVVAALSAGDVDVAVGSSSLAVGVDIPGEELSCVVLMKWPNPSPGDPWVKGQIRRYGGSGAAWAGLLGPLGDVGGRQAVGRLIRAEGDSGVVAFLDPRERQVKKFISAMAPSGVVSDLAVLERALGVGGGGGVGA